MLDALGVGLDPGDRVVEIGCGAGRQTRALAARAECVRALDISEAMLARAPAHGDRAGDLQEVARRPRSAT
ncbi:MAG: class I SAM-dependent methyltransferase [Actinomycetota bacterium]|nr:class I SAM-dependent methyltransferase [Actinomycetota bacterium]